MLGRFGKFTLVERIAEGGMAEVFKATVRGPEGFERIVAIKRLHRALCEDADLTQMLVDEARIAVQLNHPNIGNVFDLGCIENQYFIIMEYIDGTDLLHLLEESRMQGRLMPVPAALFALSETLSGLHYAHTKLGRNGQPLGIVHRDVSPQNMMITWDGRVKLVDFGIAKARNRAQTTQHGIIKGKFYYMAPEQAQGHHVDSRTDVYAAGMVLYEALAGRSPYDDVPEIELLRYVRRADFPPPSAYRPDLDPELSALVEVATQRNPEKRFANAMEFQLALNDYRHRKLGAFAEPHMARVVAQIANAADSNDNFRPMDRGAYRPSEESLLFEQPSAAELAMAAGGSDIGRGRDDNPFGDDLPTEIYDQNAHPGKNPRLDLPPAPARRGGGRPEEQTHGELPSNNGFASQRPFSASPPPVQPEMQNARARRQTKPSIVDRVAKPKYVYMAIFLAVALVCGLGFALMSSRAPEGAESDEPESIGTDGAVAENDGETKKVAVAFASEPPNAQVFLNDIDKGTTPLSLELEVGKTFRVEFLKDGFEVDRQELLVSEEEAEVTAELAQARGILKILSFPPDAVIFIEDEEQGATPLTLTGMETDQTYEITARLGDKEKTTKVEWKEDGDDPVQEVMFEFAKAGDGAQVTLNLGDLPDSIDTPKSKPRRKTFKRRRPRRKARSRPKARAEKEDDSGGLDVFGSASKSTSSDDEDEDLNVFGSSSKSSSSSSDDDKKEVEDEDLNVFGSSSKSSSKKAAPKKEEDSSDDDLNVFGASSKKTSAKKKPAKKSSKKKAEKDDDDDEDLDIWGKPKKSGSSKKKKKEEDEGLGDIW